MRHLALLTCALVSCAPAPNVVLQFPDAQAEADGAELSMYALSPLMDCTPLMLTGKVDTWLASVTARLPLSEPAHLGKLSRGPTVWFAEVRDKDGAAFLRGCQSAESGAEIVVELQYVLKPIHMREGDVLSVGLHGSTPFRLAATGVPKFVKYDDSTRQLNLTPLSADQGSYTFNLEPVAAMNGVYPLAVALTVDDVPRPLKWDRLYRGWHGRFDAAALWDPLYRQLFVTGGRDDGIDLAKSNHTLFVSSNAPDVRSDYRVLAFPGDGGLTTGDWSVGQLLRTSTSGKYGHVMGYVRTDDTNEVLGFVLGGSDGSQLSAETLIFRPGNRVTLAAGPTALMNPQSAFRVGMAAAIEPDYSTTYLFGGDSGGNTYTNELLQVKAPNGTTIAIERLITSPAKPSIRSNAAMALALNPKRLVVIGGRDNSPAELIDDVWIICLEESGPKCPPGSRLQWMKVNKTGDLFPGPAGAPSPGVSGLVAGYDAPNDRVITYGGIGVSGNQAYLYEDAFALDLSAAVPVDGGISARFTHLPPPGGPYGLVASAAGYDADAGRLLLYAGVTGRLINGVAQGDITEDVWALGLDPGAEKLTRVATSPQVVVPSRRVAGNLIARPMLMFAGQGEGIDPLDEWLVTGDGGVTKVTTAGNTPLPRANMAVTYNPDLDEYWMYGGRVGNQLPSAALFRYRADSGYQSLDQPDVGSRFGPSTAYDELNHRLIVFGGVGIDDATGMAASLNDVLALSLQNNTLVTKVLKPLGTPPEGRYGALAGYDRFQQRMLIYGGTATQAGGAGTDSAELWQLSLVAGSEEWRKIETKGAAPPAMYLSAGVFTHENPPQLYLVGTVSRSGGTMAYQYIQDLWRLTVDADPTWLKLTPPEFRPRPRVFPSFAYDEVEHRIVLCCGASDPVFRNDVWALTLP